MNLSIVIPQIFYDVIGRIIPGLITLGLGYLVWPGKELNWGRVIDLANWSAPNKISAVAAIVSILLAAYLVATILEGLWSIPDLCHSKPDHRNGSPRIANKRSKRCELARLRWWQLARLRWWRLVRLRTRSNHISKRVLRDWGKLSTKALLDNLDNLEARALMYDEIRIHDEEVGARIAKLRAESHCYRRLITGLIFCMLLEILHLRWNWGIVVATVGTEAVLAAMLIGIAAAYITREEQWYWSLCNNWLLVCWKGQNRCP